MNRIAILFLLLIVAALALLLLYRVEAVDGPQPEATLQQVDALIRQARDGEVAADQARKTLSTIIDAGGDPHNVRQARLRLVELEQLLGNNEAAADLLLDAIQADPGSAMTPQHLFDLGLLYAGPLDRPGEAREMFSRVATLYPDHDLARESTIRLARIQKTTAEALRLHRRMTASKETENE